MSAIALQSFSLAARRRSASLIEIGEINSEAIEKKKKNKHVVIEIYCMISYTEHFNLQIK